MKLEIFSASECDSKQHTSIHERSQNVSAAVANGNCHGDSMRRVSDLVTSSVWPLPQNQVDNLVGALKFTRRVTVLRATLGSAPSLINCLTASRSPRSTASINWPLGPELS